MILSSFVSSFTKPIIHQQINSKNMKKVVLIRHGESVWNKENRFTGWTDVDLSEKGIQEAHEAGKLLKKEGFHLRKSLYFLSEKSHQDIEYRAR